MRPAVRRCPPSSALRPRRSADPGPSRHSGARWPTLRVGRASSRAACRWSGAAGRRSHGRGGPRHQPASRVTEQVEDRRAALRIAPRVVTVPRVLFSRIRRHSRGGPATCRRPSGDPFGHDPVEPDRGRSARSPTRALARISAVASGPGDHPSFESFTQQHRGTSPACWIAPTSISSRGSRRPHPEVPEPGLITGRRMARARLSKSLTMSCWWKSVVVSRVAPA